MEELQKNDNNNNNNNNIFSPLERGYWACEADALALCHLEIKTKEVVCSCRLDGGGICF